MPVEMEWYGAELAMRNDRAAGRAAVAIGMNIARETKIITHRISGTLARSTHAAPVGYMDAEGDLRRAEAGEDLFEVPHAIDTLGGMTVEVGSWLPYACVEWIGRGHPGITQGLESVRGPLTESIMHQAWLEEGLA